MRIVFSQITYKTSKFIQLKKNPQLISPLPKLNYQCLCSSVIGGIRTTAIAWIKYNWNFFFNKKKKRKSFTKIIFCEIIPYTMLDGERMRIYTKQQQCKNILKTRSDLKKKLKKKEK